MAGSKTSACNKRRGSPRRRIRFLATLLLFGVAATAQAQDCSDYPNGVIDGFAGDVAPSQLQIDRNCTIRNFPADNPLRTNFSFFTRPGQTNERWLIIFDNVVHTGNMSCNDVLEHKIWFTNGSSSKIRDNCQNLLIPVEKIDKQNPPGTTTAAIGVPFTYTLTMPVLFDPATETVINVQGSVNDLHSATLTDDLNATGVDLTYVSHTAYWKDTGDPVPHTFSNVGGFLTFDNFPIIPATEQIVIEITVVLEDSPVNVIGTQFINTAKWNFGRLIDGVFYEPLPGEWGISDPLTIAGPNLIVTKTGPATLGRTLNLGEWGQFAIDVHNAGLSEAWDVTLVDLLPNGPRGGMCNATPEILDVSVYGPGGVIPVPGKAGLVEGTDYSLVIEDAPQCRVTMVMLTPAAVIGPDEHLVVSYRTQLDSDSQDGVLLTNVAGATEWFNGEASNLDRIRYARRITDGTPGVADHQDAHTVEVRLFGYFFEKTVVNMTSGEDPAQTAAPGDVLRYTLRLQTTDGALSDVSFYDDLGEMNAGRVFVPGSLRLVPGSVPPGVDTSNTDPNGGADGEGILDLRGFDLPAFSEVSISFEVTVAGGLLDGTFITNQADLLAVSKLADSDDPNVNGQADPSVDGDEDPTRVVVEGEPPPPLLKATTQATATIGETFSYTITVPSLPHTAPLFDVRILDDLALSAADLEFVSVTRLSPGGWTPVNSGGATGLVIEDLANGIDIPAGEQVVIGIAVRLTDTSTNIAGLTFTNTASFTYNQLDGDVATVRPGEAGISGPMTIVEPALTLEKDGPINLRAGVTGTFTLDVHNAGDSPAWNLTVTDVLPDTANGGMCDAAPVLLSIQRYAADGVTPIGAALVDGTDFTSTWSGTPACTWTLEMLTSAAAIGADEHLIVTYEADLDADTQRDAVLTNIAGATEWFSIDVSDPAAQAWARTYSPPLTDGTVGILDHEDAHTVVEFTPLLRFEKTVVNVTTGDDPAAVATPGDVLRYRLYVENTSTTPVTDFSIVDEVDRLNLQATFEPGTLNIISLPAGASATGTNPFGGTAGTGLLDISGLNIGGSGESLAIEFEIQLAAVIANGTLVTNQSEIRYAGQTVSLSDDPNVNGQSDPNVSGDEDPTQVLIQSAPYFLIQKISTDLSGDPALLLAGETLRYTITVTNTGTDNATGVNIVDQVPANTTYVAGSTTLNGVAVVDTANGGSPLIDGILINAPQDPTPGAMNAGLPDNTATITFDVVVYPDAPDGTIIENQAFVSAPDQGLADLPSDDPATPVPDDPTRDVVGNFPLLFATKFAALQVDAGSPGIVDPGDVLRYTITVYNNGTVAATAAELFDNVPANTSYVADSTTLNGLSLGADGGVFPLAARLPISSADLTPPLPGAGAGALSPGESAVVQFDLQVDAATPRGTLITNQAVVYSAEVANLLTDGDGNPATGPEPTVVVVGDAQLVTIAKQVSVVDGGAALPGATLEYVVTVTNAGNVPAQYVTIRDDLDEVTPNYLVYVDQSATLNGLPAGITVAGSLITADYFTTYGALAPGATATLRFRAVIDPNLIEGTSIVNTARVYWDDPQQQAEATVSIDVGAMPDAGMLSGNVWHDADHDNVPGGLERPLEGWAVELLLNGQALRTVLTDADGFYRFINVTPSAASGATYSLRFSAPGATATTAMLGETDSDFTDGQQRIDDIDVQEGSNLLALNMPADPNGVIYDSISRAPVAGAVVTLLDARNGAAVPASCFDDPNQQDQVTVGNGYYKFDINFVDASCPSGNNYVIRVLPPSTTYIPGVSELIPPTSDTTTLPFDVPVCPGSGTDALPATSQTCEAQPSEFAPPASVPARSAGTAYHLYLRLDGSAAPGTSQLFNNHVPLDPRLDGAIGVTKTTPMLNVTRGQLVPYVITVTNTFGVDLQDVNIVDRFPAGFKYVEGSARFDGEPLEPTVTGRELSWSGITLAVDGRHTIKLLLAIGAGVSEGEFVNRAQAVNAISGGAMSGEASATVRIVPDPTFDCTDVTGKVYNDANRNGYQDNDEIGLQGVRVVTARGLAATTDAHGRYHITCAIVPNADRGSNFVLKLDDRTLPSGFRVSTRPVQVQRATRGKSLRMNFGASIHRVVGLDIADAVFEPDSAEMRSQWQPRIELLLAELEKGPSVLRLSYLADVEPPALVERRLAMLQAAIMAAWQERACCYELVIEPDIHWRLGHPPAMPKEGER